MNTRQTILNELSELNSMLAQVALPNPYTVPAGYFEKLAEEIGIRIKAEQARSAKEELNILSPLLSELIAINPYKVPEGYFETLADEALAAVNGTEVQSPVLELTGKENPYTVPAGYFENLEDELLAKVRQHPDYLSPQEELEELSPLLSGLKKEMPYEVPAGYFEGLNTKKEDTEAPVVTIPQTKVVSFTRRTWVRMLAAAMVVGVLVTGGLKMYHSKPLTEKKAVANLVKELNTMNDQQLEELAEFTNAGLTTKETVQIEPIKKIEAKAVLKDVSDKELQQLDEFMDEVESEVAENLDNNTFE